MTPPSDREIDRLPAIGAWIEAQYNLRARHPEREAIYAGYAARSAALRERLPWTALRYAAPERCAVDFFPPAVAAPDSPLLVFLHGGFWRAGDRRVFSFLAAPFVAAGAAVALVGYQLAPEVTLTRIGEQVTEALAWLLGRAAELGFSPARVTVSGHSAGGHLAALLSSRPPTALGGHRLNGAIAISGIFRIAPMLLTSINFEARIRPEEAVAQSPLFAGAFHARRHWIVAGAAETEGFVAQSRDFAAHLAALGLPCDLTLVPGRTHFDIFEAFADPGSPVFLQARAIVTATPA